MIYAIAFLTGIWLYLEFAMFVGLTMKDETDGLD